jgi:hypothetical protein
MSDPYRVQNVSRRQPARRGGGGWRGLLWVVLVISAVGNAVASLSGLGLGIRLTCGIVTVACVALLIAGYWARKRQ